MNGSGDMAVDEDARGGVGVQSPDHGNKCRGETKVGKGGKEEVAAERIVCFLEVYGKEQAWNVLAAGPFLNVKDF